jgi:undecaprenyl diphosphate synthase
MNLLERTQNFPTHIAFIMDGNGRWALNKGLKRTEGHKEGLKRMAESAQYLFDLKIPYISYYAFSLDNWSRDKTEVDYLNGLIKQFYEKEFQNLKKKGKRILVSGVKDKLDKSTVEIIENIEKETQSFDDGTLNICFNYGARREIVEACKKIARKFKENELCLEDLNTESFYQYLFKPEVPPVDFLVRTSGEIRISDFLLYQISYSELYFTDVLWPDFSKKEIEKSLLNYEERQRRFGGIKNE